MNGHEEGKEGRRDDHHQHTSATAATKRRRCQQQGKAESVRRSGLLMERFVTCRVRVFTRTPASSSGGTKEGARACVTVSGKWSKC